MFEIVLRVDALEADASLDAMAEMERLAAQLPQGFGYEWTGQSREEKLSGAQAGILLAFSMLAVFLCLSALYESWSVPLPVLLSVSVGVLGAIGFVWAMGLAFDVYAQIGLVMLIGLACKNAILIVEFATQRHREGLSVFEAAIEGAKVRFRPILMTSFAFIAGMVPLLRANQLTALASALRVPVYTAP